MKKQLFYEAPSLEIVETVLEMNFLATGGYDEPVQDDDEEPLFPYLKLNHEKNSLCTGSTCRSSSLQQARIPSQDSPCPRYCRGFFFGFQSRF